MVLASSLSIGVVASTSGGGVGVIALVSAVLSSLLFVYGDYVAGLEGLRVLVRPSHLYVAKSLATLISSIVSSIPAMVLVAGSLDGLVRGVAAVFAGSATASLAAALAGSAGVSASAALVIGIALSLPPIYAVASGMGLLQSIGVAVSMFAMGVAISELVRGL